MARLAYAGLLVLLVTWMVLSGVSWMFQDAQLFQRSGVFGIAAAIGIYGLLARARKDQIGRLAAAENTALEQKVMLETKRVKAEVLDVVTNLLVRTVVGDEAHSLSNAASAEVVAAKESLNAIERNLQSFASAVDSVKREIAASEARFFRNELMVLVLATLQTGFGDVFVRNMLGAQ